MKRRKILIVLVATISVIGFSALMVALLQSMTPTNATKSERVFRVDITDIPLDGYRRYEWYGHAIAIFRPGAKSVDYLLDTNPIANGPDYVKETFPTLFVYEPRSTYKGCGLMASSKGDSLWPKYQGWFDPCHMGFWDFSGRNLPGVLAPSDANLSDLTKITEVEWVTQSTIDITLYP